VTNRLYYGDNLNVLRDHVASESIDLVYLDPPFNSNANYNILFKSPTGTQSDAQIEAFEDTWHWNDRAEDAFDQVARSGNTKAFDLLNAMRGFLSENDMMAYLSMMAIRLIELHRVLKPTGSLYLHCDPTASHYLKLLLDGVFGADRFSNEIIWRRTGSHSPRKSFGPIHDTILSYTKSSSAKFNVIRRPYMKGHVDSRYTESGDGKMKFSSGENVLTGAGKTFGVSGTEWRGFDPSSKSCHWAVPSFYEEMMPDEYRNLNTVEKLEALYQAGLVEIKEGVAWPIMVRYLDERDGTPLSDIWAYQPYTGGTVWGTSEGVDADVMWLGPTDPERLGYPTQKPVGLLERIIAASSNEGDVVLDPFCGCGTAVHAAQKLGRQWIGIDVTHLAISLIEKRMRAAFPGIAFTVEGTPKDLTSAEDLARRDKYQFQWWAVSMVDAMPFGGKKKGADGGVDGIIYFKPDGKKTEKAIVSVKGGDNVSVAMIRDLHSAMEREHAPMGVFITKALPTKPMEREAAAVGVFHSAATGKSYPRLQIVTLAELFAGKRPDIPFVDAGAAFKRAAREDSARQGSLL